MMFVFFLTITGAIQLYSNPPIDEQILDIDKPVKENELDKEDNINNAVYPIDNNDTFELITSRNDLFVPTVVFASQLRHGERSPMLDNLERYLFWALTINNIQPKYITDCKGQFNLDNADIVIINTEIAQDEHKIVIKIRLSDVVNDRILNFELLPGEWYTGLRIIADSLLKEIVGHSDAFTRRVFGVQRINLMDNLVTTYLDGTDVAYIGESFRAILDINPTRSGLIFTALQESKLSIFHYAWSGETTRLTQLGEDVYSPAMHNDKLAFSKLQKDGTSALLITTNLGKDIDVVFNQPFCSATSASFSPDGSHLAFIAIQDNNQSLNIFDGIKISKVQIHKEAARVKWSPQNPEMLALLTKEGNDYVVQLINTEGMIYNESIPLKNVTSLEWKSDGSGVIICMPDEKDIYSIYLLPLYMLPENERLKNKIEPIKACNTHNGYKFAIMI